MSRLIIVLIFAILAGCAPPSTLAPERSAVIRRIGVVTSVPDDTLQVFDHTGTRTIRAPFFYSNSLDSLLLGNLLSGVAESLVNMGIAKYKIDKSLGGTPDKASPLVLRDFKVALDKSIEEKLSEKYRVVSPDCFDSQGQTLHTRSQCLEKARLLDLDTLAFIELAYGFAAYNERSASVSIDGILIAYDVASGKIILRKELESDQDFREHRALDEFTKDNGRLFKEDLHSAINAFSSYAARQLGVWK